MRWTFATAAAWAMVALACVKLAVSDTNPSGQRTSALSVIHLIQAAEADYFHAHGRYATFVELIKSKQLAQTATGAPQNLHAYFSLNLESESEPVPGFTLAMDIPADGATYKLSVERPGNCSLGFRADDKGAIYEDKASDCSSGTNTEDASVPWGPADIDQAMMPTRANAPCPLSEVLEGVSYRARELEENLQKFTAREQIEHLEIGKNGKQRSGTSNNFNYVAEIFDSEGGAYINEYRSEIGGAATEHVPLADTGTAAFALVFLPHNMEEFVITCEGLTELDARTVWQLHFVQRTDRANDFRAYRINSQLYPVNIKGRAWVTPDTFEVLRLESDLVAPIKEIHLDREHLVIDYGPVAFPKRDVRLWLPDSVTLYIEYRGHRYERRHRFSGFQLFSVDTVQETKGPRPDRDIQPDKDIQKD